MSIIFDEFMNILSEVKDTVGKERLDAVGFDLSLFDELIVFQVDSVETKVKSILGNRKGISEQELFDARFLSLRLPYPRMFVEWQNDPYPLRFSRDEIKAGARPVIGIAVVLLGWLEGDRYRINAHIAYKTHSHILPSSWIVDVWLDESGELESIDWEIDDLDNKKITPDDLAKAKTALYRHLYTVFMTISLLHCRNVQTIENEQPYTPKMARRGEKKGTSYKTLVIKPMKARAQRETPEREGTGGKRRLHLVRGHFKEFTEDAPLFGRLVGRYWWESMARGSQEQGIVIKDYRIESE